MGKRNTAKVGERGLYKLRDRLAHQEETNNVDNDDMYNEIDRYNNARNELQEDMLKFDQSDESEEEGMQNNDEGVFNLGLDESEEDSDSDDSEEESSVDGDEAPRLPLEASDDDDDSIDDLEPEDSDILNWGKQKKDYYHGDTADLEIMDRNDALEDAELEEQGAKEILKNRLEGMTEEDFMLDDDDDSDNSDESDAEEEEKIQDSVQVMTNEMHSSKRRKLSSLSKKDKIKFMSKTHPELLPLVDHFREEVIRPCAEKTSVVVNALLQDEKNAEAVGATKTGLQFLLAKAMIQTSTALNVCQYLMIKSGQAMNTMDDEDNILDNDDDDNIKNHPVISRLNQLNHLVDRLESKVETKVGGLTDQFENLVKASALMGDISNDHESDEDGDESDAQSDDLNSDVDYDAILAKGANQDHSDDESTASSSDEEDDGAIQKRLLNETRFALRNQDDDMDPTTFSKKRRRRAMPTFSDFGDGDDANETDVAAASKTLATTINRISQRSNSGKGASAAPETTDEADTDRFRRGLEMMEAELGGLGSDEDEDDIDNGEVDNDSMDDDDDFYSKIQQKSKARKEFKKSLYAVAPKYPGFDAETEGERAIGNMIMKNRGLVAHKNKLNRNPRVKKREQYRKALIKRKGAVREVRTDEGHKYGGETTGIRSGLSRSRKLGS